MNKETIMMFVFYGILLLLGVIQFVRHKKRLELDRLVMYTARELNEFAISEDAEHIESVIISMLYKRYKLLCLIITKKRLLQLVDYAVETTSRSLLKKAKELDK